MHNLTNKAHLHLNALSINNIFPEKGRVWNLVKGINSERSICVGKELVWHAEEDEERVELKQRKMMRQPGKDLDLAG